MNSESKAWWLVFALILYFSGSALAQENVQNEAFVINGVQGEAKILQIEGHKYIDINELARITNGSLSLQENRLILTLPVSGGSLADIASQSSDAEPGFSRHFMRAGIEATASMREWRSTLALLIRNGYPVGNEMLSYSGRARDRLILAAAEVATPSDRSGFQLLSNEFQNLSAWSNGLVNAQNSASAGEYVMSDDALNNDSMFQKISQCDEFLGPMLASGNFEDNAACH
ncbi:MAG TPA: hypothetical protein VK699_14715 [Terriglobales bacterium]|jgi:hypothetical protein|nr:hypothetical protein [Terriglobales bacterium]